MFFACMPWSWMRVFQFLSVQVHFLFLIIISRRLTRLDPFLFLDLMQSTSSNISPCSRRLSDSAVLCSGISAERSLKFWARDQWVASIVGPLFLFVTNKNVSRESLGLGKSCSACMLLTSIEGFSVVAAFVIFCLCQYLHCSPHHWQLSMTTINEIKALSVRHHVHTQCLVEIESSI